MKHYVLGFVFNRYRDEVLLIKKERPIWQKGHWNGIGGKIKDVVPRQYGRTFETPAEAMVRECEEETGMDAIDFEHTITMLCDGGTVFIYRAFCGAEKVPFMTVEDELLLTWPVDGLPAKVVSDCKWMIEMCLSKGVKFPIVIQKDGVV